MQAYLLWRIENTDDSALKFFTAFRSIDEANRNLEQQLQGALRAIGSLSYADIVGAKSRLADAEKAILAGLGGARAAGVEPVSVGLSQVVLPQKTTVSVLSRMSEVQNTLAKLEGAKATSQAEALKSQASSQADTIRAFATQWASRIENKGNAEATVYYEKMKEHADLATFLAWIDAMRAGLRGSTTYVGDTSQAPFHLFNLNSRVDKNGIPQPPEASKSSAKPATAAAGGEAGQ